MFSARLIIDTDIIDAYAGIARTAPRTVSIFVNKTVRRDVSRRLLGNLREEPGPVVYPIKWKTARQRRAFFATNGFGRGIPARRTGALAGAWKVTADTDLEGGFIEVGNDTPYFQFVYGPDQQPFHTNTGWMDLNDIDEHIVDASEFAANMLIDGWFSINEPGKGVRLA